MVCIWIGYILAFSFYEAPNFAKGTNFLKPTIYDAKDANWTLWFSSWGATVSLARICHVLLYSETSTMQEYLS